MTKIGRLAYVITSDTSQFTRGLVASSSELRRAKAIFEETRTPAERYGQEVDQLTMLLAKGAIDMDTYTRKLAQVKGAYDQVTASAKANAQATRLANANAAAPIGRMTGFGGASGTIVASGQFERAARGSNMLLGSLRGLLPIMGAIGTVRFLGSSIGEFEAAEAEARKLEAVLKATGNASGRTAGQMKEQASALQRLTGVSDDAITGGQALLATFKAVRGEAFDRATRAALDLSVVMGGDLHGAVMQLGKALQDPIRGLTSLRRAGVDFTTQQQAQIRELVAQNQLLQAQRIILAEVESQVGGAAAATATATQKMKASWADLKEEIGGVVSTLADDLTRPITGAGAQGSIQMSLDGWTMALADFRALWTSSGAEMRADAETQALAAAAQVSVQERVSAILAREQVQRNAIHAAEQAANRAMSQREAAEAEALAKMTKRTGLMERIKEIELKRATLGKSDVERQIEEAARAGEVDRRGELAFRLRAADRQLQAEEAAHKERQEALAEEEKQMKSLAEAGKRVFEETRTPMERYREELQKLNELLELGHINTDTFERKVAALRRQHQGAEQARDDAGRRPDATGPLRAPALERGTAAAFSASFGSAISRTADERIARATEESRRSLQRLVEALT